MPINVLTKDDFTPKPFEEAKRAFMRKIVLTSEEFDRLAREHRRHAFRIATVNNARLVQHARDLLAKAVRDGTSFRDFRRAMIALFDTAGVPRPAMHRLQLVFRQNVLQAYSDSRRETLDKRHITAAFPYRLYLTVGNGTAGVRNVRADHAVLHNKVFRWDDRFWDRFTPPWDYGCRCTFVALGTIPTATEFLDAMQTIKAQMWRFKDDKGRPANNVAMQSVRVIAPPTYERAAKEALHATDLINTTNVYGHGLAEVDLTPWLTADNKMYVHAIGAQRKGIIYQQRTPMELVVLDSPDWVNVNEGVLFLLRERFRFAYGDFRRMTEHTFS